ncbi:hypothetical protein HDU98_001708 [Podochytrium sp. JEL0797]|nr:hypothetical protein HDU98_001708 [Podochytrium sp. JEL0797]
MSERATKPATTAGSWFANGSQALTSGLSLVSSIVNDVASDRPQDESTSHIQAELHSQLALKDQRIQSLEAKIASFQQTQPPPSDLEQRNTLLQEKLAKAVSHLKPLVEENRSLKAKMLASQEQSPSQLPSADLTAKLQTLESKLTSLTSTNQHLAESLTQAETEATALSMELDTYKQRVAELEQDGSDSVAAMASAMQDEVEVVRTENRGLVETVEGLNAELEALKSHSANAGDALAEMQLQVSAAHQENRELKAAVKGLEAEVGTLRSENGNLKEGGVVAGDAMKAEVVAMHEENQGLIETVRDLEFEVETLRVENSVAKGKLVQLESEIEERVALVAAQSTKLAETEAKVSDLEAQVGRVAELEHQVASLTESLDLQQNQLQNGSNDESATQQLAKDLQAAHDAHAVTSKSLQEAQEKINKLATRLKQTIEKNQTLNKQLKANPTSTTPPPAADSPTLQATLESTQRELHTLQTSHAEETAHLTEELQFLQSEIEGQQTTIRDLTQSLKLTQEASSNLEFKAQEQESLCAQLQDQLDSALAAATPTKESSTSEDSPNRTVTLESELQLETLKSTTAALESEASTLRTENATLRTDNTTLTESLHALETKHAKLTTKMQQTVESSNDLSQQVDELSSTLQQLQESMSTLESRNMSLSDLNATLETRVTESSDLVETLRDSTQVLQATVVEKETLVGELTRRVESLQDSMEALEAAVEEKDAVVVQLRREVETMSVSVSANAGEVPELQQQLSYSERERESLVHQLAELTQTYENTVMESQTQLAAAQTRVVELESALRELESVEVTLRSRVEELTALGVSDKESFDRQWMQMVGEVEGVVVMIVESVESKGDLARLEFGELEVVPVSLKEGLNRLKDVVGAALADGAGGEKGVEVDASVMGSVKAEYEQMMVDLNAELEDKSHALSQLQLNFNSVSSEKDALSSEHRVLMDKMNKVKTTLAPKLQEEMESNKNLRSHVESLTQQIANLTDEKHLLKSQIADLTTVVSDSQLQIASVTAAASTPLPSTSTDELVSLQTQITHLTLENEKLLQQLTTLQHYMAESEESYSQDLLKTQSTMDEYKHQLDALERERETWESMVSDSTVQLQMAEENAEQAQRDAMEARALLEEAVKGRERDLIGLGNLQSVLEEFQASKQSEIDMAVETISKQLTTATHHLQEYRARAESAELQLSQIDTTAPNSSDQHQLQERTAEIGKLRGRVISLETYLSEAIRRAASADNQVDRRLVSNLIVQFLGTQRGDSKRFEMLTVIASVLKLNDEDKVKIGLLRAVGGGGGASANKSARSPGGGGAGETFTDLWISFLIQEAGEKKQDAGGKGGEGVTAGASGPVVVKGEVEGVANGAPNRPASRLGFFGGWGGSSVEAKKSS